MRQTKRDEFSSSTKRTLAERVGYCCSNPACGRKTVGPNSNTRKSSSIGEAAHIHAAAPNGPRYDPSMTQDKRASEENGIWLCKTCARLIDVDTGRYTAELLHEWKRQAEEAAEKEISSLEKKSRNNTHDLILDKKRICDLESSVGNYEKTRYAQSDEIFIQASKYYVDNDDPFQQVIVWNLRKGVKYNYLIPKNSASQNKFRETVKGWYNLYASLLESESSYACFFEEISKQEILTSYELSKYWSMEYNDIVKSAKMIWENKLYKGQQDVLSFARKKCIDVFLNNLNVFITKSKIYMTIAIYEIKDSFGNHRQWKGLMKPTTVRPKTEYKATALDESSNSDDAALIDEFKTEFYDTAALERGNKLKESLREDLYKRYGIE